MELIDSLPELNKLDIEITESKSIEINDLTIFNPVINLKYFDEHGEVFASSNINNILSFKLASNVIFTDRWLQITLDELNLNYDDYFEWNSINPINISASASEYKISNFAINRVKSETISFSGSLIGENFNNVRLNLTNFPLSDINKILKQKDNPLLDSLKGYVDSLDIFLNGTFKEPIITLLLKSNNPIVNNIKVGSISANLFYQRENANGNIEIFNNNDNNNQKIFNFLVNAFPINLSIGDVKERIHNKFPIDIYAIGEKLPLVLVSPFLSGIVKHLNGYLDTELNLTGYYPDKINYNGNAKLSNVNFLLEATNMYFNANGEVEIETDNIKLKNIKVVNKEWDLVDGKAEITGDVKFQKLDFKSFNFVVNTDKFKVLSPASVKSIPMIYGDIIISTGPAPLKFHGNLQNPVLDGNINILKANLTLPQMASQETIKTRVKYEVKGNKLFIRTVEDNSSVASNIVETNKQNEKSESNQNVNFAEMIDYNLQVKILDRVLVNIDLGFLGQLYADVGTPDKTIPIYYKASPRTREPKISGELLLREGSTLNYIKQFKTTGTIYFPTGSLTNPGLNLEAQYFGKNYTTNPAKEFSVSLKITGTKDKPNIKFDYTMQGEPAIGDSSKITQDALLLLIIGKTKDDLTSGSNQSNIFGDIQEIGSSSLTSSVGVLASKTATELFQGFLGVENADIQFEGGKLDIDKARLQISGRWFGNVTWRFGGTMADFSNNNEISIDFPLPFVLHKDFLNNIIFQLTKSTSISPNPTLNQKDWEIKLKFGGSW